MLLGRNTVHHKEYELRLLRRQVMPNLTSRFYVKSNEKAGLVFVENDGPKVVEGLLFHYRVYKDYLQTLSSCSLAILIQSYLPQSLALPSPAAS